MDKAYLVRVITHDFNGYPCKTQKSAIEKNGMWVSSHLDSIIIYLKF